MLRGRRTDLPANIGRETAAAALREAITPEELQVAARTSPDQHRRIAAGIALALMDDPVAREMVQSDPVSEVRDQVSRMLGPVRSDG
jgi:uncharacterized protein YgbK (DUF1537 family)